MSQSARFLRSFTVTALIAGLFAAGLAASPPAAAQSRLVSATASLDRPVGKSGPVRTEGVRMAEADCSAAAAEAAAETGGQVLSVSSREQGGRTVCVVTVLVPGADGERPRKQTITVPQ